MWQRTNDLSPAVRPAGDREATAESLRTIGHGAQPEPALDIGPDSPAIIMDEQSSAGGVF